MIDCRLARCSTATRAVASRPPRDRGGHKPALCIHVRWCIGPSVEINITKTESTVVPTCQRVLRRYSSSSWRFALYWFSPGHMTTEIASLPQLESLGFRGKSSRRRGQKSNRVCLKRHQFCILNTRPALSPPFQYQTHPTSTSLTESHNPYLYFHRQPQQKHHNVVNHLNPIPAQNASPRTTAKAARADHQVGQPCPSRS